MLGLARRAIYFTILREEVLFGKNLPYNNCGLTGHFADKCTNKPKELNKGNNNNNNKCKPCIFAGLIYIT